MDLPTHIQDLIVSIVHKTVNHFIPLDSSLFYTKDYSVYDKPEDIPQDEPYITGDDVLSYINLFQDFIFPNDIDIFKVSREELIEYVGSDTIDLNVAQKIKLLTISTVNTLVH